MPSRVELHKHAIKIKWLGLDFTFQHSQISDNTHRGGETERGELECALRSSSIWNFRHTQLEALLFVEFNWSELLSIQMSNKLRNATQRPKVDNKVDA